MSNQKGKPEPKIKILYCEDASSDALKAEKYIKFIKHLVNVVKEQEEISKKNTKKGDNYV